jgi:hypothetical protein
MMNVPFAFLNLGAMELIILGLLATVGVGVAIVILIVNSGKNKDDGDD